MSAVLFSNTTDLFSNTTDIQQLCDQLFFRNNILNESVIEKSIYTPFLFLYKILPLNVVFPSLESQSHLKSLMFL